MFNMADVLDRKVDFELMSKRFLTCSLASMKTFPLYSPQTNLPFSHRSQKGRLSSYRPPIISDLALGNYEFKTLEERVDGKLL